MRSFTAPDGKQWEVFEVKRVTDRAVTVRQGLEHGWLSFQSEEELRRVGNYPADWQMLSDTALAKLCAVGLPARRRGDFFIGPPATATPSEVPTENPE